MSNLFNEYNSSPENILSQIKEYLEERQYQSYSKITGLCNPVLAKNPFTSNFVQEYLKNTNAMFSLAALLRSWMLFQIHNTYTLFFECLKILVVRKTSSLPSQSELVILSFFNYHKMENSLFDELYLPGLQRELVEKKISFGYFPKLHLFPKNPFATKKALLSIKEKNPAFISIYEVIPRRKLFKLIYLSFSYFYESLKTIKPFSKKPIDQAYNRALIESIKFSEAFKLVHYLAAEEFFKTCSAKKVVLWYENQTIDKCIIKAIRESGKDIEIIGCQFFLITPQEQNLYPSKYEIKNNLLPDKIFTMQESLPTSDIKERYFLGKGLRYLYLQNYNPATLAAGEENVYTVFLTIFRETNKKLLDILSQTKFECKKLMIKKHPVLMTDQLPKINHSEEVNLPQEKLLIQSDLIFATDTGLIYEAMAMNRQVIIIGFENSVNHFIPPIEYHNKLWVRVTTPEELSAAIILLKNYRKDHLEDLRALSQKVKSTYFQNSEKNILELLNIHNGQ